MGPCSRLRLVPLALPSLALIGALLVLVAASCASETTSSTGPTYHRDIAPLLATACGRCHDGSGVAPYRFDDYDSAYDLRAAILDAVISRRMPPWPPGGDCAPLVGDPSLDPDDIDLLVAWDEAGAPAGDPASAPPPLATSPVGGLSRIDKTVQLPEPYLPESLADDVYRCFPIAWDEAEPQFATGFAVRPGAAANVHHVIAFVAGPDQVSAIQELDDAEPGPGYSCYGGPSVSAGWLGVWTPGSIGVDFPAATGIRIDPGSTVILQVHYSSVTHPYEQDRTALDLRLDATVEREAWIQPWFDPTWMAEGAMHIGAGEPAVAFESSFDPTIFVSHGEPFTIHAAGIHMHALGDSGSLHIERANGEKQCVLTIPSWDFHWQGAYGLEQPIVVHPGDRIVQHCQFDNTASNQIFAGGQQLPPIDVDWGEGTRDEMCLAAFYATLGTPEGT